MVAGMAGKAKTDGSAEATQDAQQAFDELPLLLTVEQARPFLKPLGRNGIYSAAKRAEIPHIVVGRRLLIPREGLRRLLEGEPTADRPVCSVTTNGRPKPNNSK